MSFLSRPEQAFVEAVSGAAFSNPFLPEHTQFERAALGKDFEDAEPLWSLPVDQPDRPRANVLRIAQRLEPLASALRTRLNSAIAIHQLRLYEDAILQLLYQRYYPHIAKANWSCYKDFLEDWHYFFSIPGVNLPSGHQPAHTFACFRQLQRAFDQILRDIIGSSLPAARLRASIWQSIFTHDMRRYWRTLYSRMGEFVTLITGPSGTGKELAARAIAQARYLPFNERSLRFEGDPQPIFFPINISALSPTLVESELFGHRRGSFTGAIADRKGWLEMCPAYGSVFLDEIGDLDPSIQVKLLRVIETRTFHAVGESTSREFKGKLIAATNRDLAMRMRDAHFREDLYYRLCSDQIVTPPLADQLRESPQMLNELVLYMSRRVAGPGAPELAAEVTREVISWIGDNLPPHYPWPGNYRELEQCVKNVLIRRDYRPSQGRASSSSPPSALEELQRDFSAGRLKAEDLICRYASLVYRQTGSYEETARRIGLDRRTVKAKVDKVKQT
jgi:transcriptional regulator with AAA-type ATPase domain